MDFQSYYDKIIPKDKDIKARYFERSIRDYFESSSKYRGMVKKACLWDDWKYKDGSDNGIDLIVEGHNNDDFWAVQCKCYNKNSTLSKKDIDSFISDSSRIFHCEGKRSVSFSQRIVVTTLDEIGKNAERALQNQNPPCNLIRYIDLLDDKSFTWFLDEEISSYESVKDSEQEYKSKTQGQKTIRDYQQRAIDSVKQAFQDDEEPVDRGQLIMACGTGKTFTSLKIKEALHSRRSLYIVPSLSLLAQTMQEWNENSQERQVHLIVSSDKTIKTQEIEKDDVEEDASDRFLTGIPSTTDSEVIKKFLLKKRDNPIVVFSTYQSLEEVIKAQNDESVPDFDITFCDEAHRTTGLQGTESTIILDDNKIRSQKRLFMTATPRFYSDRIKTKGRKQNKILYSMDNHEKYGRVLFRYDFPEAIADNNLCDYKVVLLKKTIDKTEKEIKDISEYSKDVLIPFWNFLSKNNLKKGLVFFNKRSESKKFKDEFNKQDGNVELHVDHVDGTMGGYKRRVKMDWLREESKDIRLLSNVKCLSEGVDVPKIDACVFAKPRKSTVDIVQAVGRAIRKADNKSYGHIVLPILIPKDSNVTQTLSHSGFDLISKVLTSLRIHDESLGNEIDKMRFKKSYKDSSQKKNSDRLHYGEDQPKITVWDGDRGEEIPLDPDLSSESDPQMKLFCENVHAHIVENFSDPNHIDNWIFHVRDLGEELKRKLRKELKENKRFQEKVAKLRESLKKNVNKNIRQRDVVLMLVQHLLTEPIFNALFPQEELLKHNPLAQSLEQVLRVLSQDKDNLRKSLNPFYDEVEQKASDLADPKDKQEFLNKLYEKFFLTFDRKKAQRDGVVYTPQDIVKFMIRMTDQIMEKEFGYGLEKEDVHIIDPFTGTGNFIVNLLKYFEEKKVSTKDIQRNYEREVHANEISLLPYYIASANIEHTYHTVTNNYHSYENICLVDTFSLAESDQETFDFVKDKNVARIEKQKNLPIQIFLSNPPYNQGQKTANDNNAATKHAILEKRIKDTYVLERSDKTSAPQYLYNAYIKAFRFSSDRIKEKGIVAFITNNQFIHKNSASGFRISLEREFSSVYHVDLKGNARHLSKEDLKKQGGNVFNIMTGVGITFLVKNPQKKNNDIFLYHVPNSIKEKEKIDIIKNFQKLEEISFQKVVPDEKSFWIQAGRKEWKNFLSLRSDKKTGQNGIFVLGETGTKTNRYDWSYAFNKKDLEDKISLLIKTYKKDLEKIQSLSEDERRKISKNIDGFITKNVKKIKWDNKLKNFLKREKKISNYKDSFVRQSFKRAFCKTFLYYDDSLISSKYRGFEAFPFDNSGNITISFTDKNEGDFSCLVMNELLNKNIYSIARHFPLYRYENDQKLDNITDWALEQFQKQYSKKPLSKEQIFSYVYGILNSSEYRKLYKDNLFRENAKVPLYKSYNDFLRCSTLGQELIDLHLNYESIPPYENVHIIKQETTQKISNEEFYRVKKMKLSKDKKTLIYNQYITIDNIPEKAFEWTINGHGAINELIKHYKYKELDNGFINDPNSWAGGKYIFDLLLSVLSLSIKTAAIIQKIPRIEGNIFLKS